MIIKLDFLKLFWVFVFDIHARCVNYSFFSQTWILRCLFFVSVTAEHIQFGLDLRKERTGSVFCL